MTFQSLLHPSIGSLSDLISHEDWNLVYMYLNSGYSYLSASKWTLVPGFFDGLFDSHVLPIHQACALCPPKEVTERLSRCYPEGLRLKEDAFSRIPLHIACLTKASKDVIQFLLENYPEGARCKDSIGRLPIHYACAHDVEEEVIEMLLHSFPASAGCADNSGWLPLHVACRRGLSVNVIRQLINCFPPAVDMHTKKGSTALMCAQKGGVERNHLDIVELLNEELMKQSNIGWGNKLDETQVLSTGICTLRHRNVHAKGA